MLRSHYTNELESYMQNAQKMNTENTNRMGVQQRLKNKQCYDRKAAIFNLLQATFRHCPNIYHYRFQHMSLIYHPLCFCLRHTRRYMRDMTIRCSVQNAFAQAVRSLSAAALLRSAVIRVRRWGVGVRWGRGLLPSTAIATRHSPVPTWKSLLPPREAPDQPLPLQRVAGRGCGRSSMRPVSRMSHGLVGSHVKVPAHRDTRRVTLFPPSAHQSLVCPVGNVIR